LGRYIRMVDFRYETHFRRFERIIIRNFDVDIICPPYNQSPILKASPAHGQQGSILATNKLAANPAQLSHTEQRRNIPS
jgi:hypothetical protein